VPSRSIELPTPDRVERIVRPGLHQAEKILTAPIWARLPTEVRARLLALVSTDAGEADSGLRACWARTSGSP
jgi:hypothetical protein